MKRTYVFLDTETTGLLSPDSSDIDLQPHMTELSLIKTDDDLKIVDEFHSLFSIPIPVPEIITRITGISDETLRGKPTFLQKRNEITKFIFGTTHIVGHNVNFDMDVLKFELRRLAMEHYFPWPPVRHCTVEISFPIENKRLKLSQLYFLATGKTHEGAHRSDADTKATIDCYRWLNEMEFV